MADLNERYASKLAARATGKTKVETYPASKDAPLAELTPEDRFRRKLAAHLTPKPEEKHKVEAKVESTATGSGSGGDSGKSDEKSGGKGGDPPKSDQGGKR
jgi:hypothetical protein